MLSGRSFERQQKRMQEEGKTVDKQLVKLISSRHNLMKGVLI